MNLRFCLLLAFLFVVGCKDSPAPQASSNDSQAASSSTKTGTNDEPQSFGDFSFSIPSGWSVVSPDRDKTKAMLLLGGTNWRNAKAMIKVDVGRPPAPTAKQLAEGFANSAGGTVSADLLDFDGAAGFSASTSSTELTTPRNMIAVYRDGKAYLLMAGAIADVDLRDALSHVRESWKWTKPDAK